MASAKVMDDNMNRCHDTMSKSAMGTRLKVMGMKPLVAKTTKAEVSNKSSELRIKPAFLEVPISAAI